MQNNEEKLAWRVLETLFEFGRADVPASPRALSSCLGVPETHVQEMLARLDAQGLVDRERCRLSMKGLVLAVSMHGAQKLDRHSIAA
jgi:Mn-dependent DtxR family transcriptional regulator